MPRLPINLHLKSLDKFSFLVHSGPGAGKSHLLFDALYHERANGPVVFINIAGQDGYLSGAEYDFGPELIAETVDTLKDLNDLLTEVGNASCIALDSVRDLLRLCVVNTTGSDRPPRAGKTENEYSQIYFDFEKTLRELKSSCKRFVTCSTSDRSVDQLTNNVNIVPDLMGRWSNGIASMVDFVGYMDATTNMGRVKRFLHFEPMTVTIGRDNEIAVLTRQRLARTLTKPLEVKTGKGAWQEILQIFEEHLCPGEEEVKTKWRRDHV